MGMINPSHGLRLGNDHVFVGRVSRDQAGDDLTMITKL